MFIINNIMPILFKDGFFEKTYLIFEVSPSDILEEYAKVISSFARPKDIESLFCYSLSKWKGGHVKVSCYKPLKGSVCCTIETLRNYNQETGEVNVSFKVVADKLNIEIALANTFQGSEDMIKLKDYYINHL